MKIEIDNETQTMTIQGVKYSFGIFNALGFAPVGAVFEILSREDGVVTVRQLADSEKKALEPV